ncbi:hypothetical protein [Lyngbya sp. CCY1209]|uniref:hypothetical protein n=1 Tax=Lyngbya sp. CCY1209 TaxID=2886103 RepID=UPI002D1FEC3C|nr:hypothetical protein [Lyngbya sp. CCY1209]MEB3885337.1 hypothetical protein [Lyngbya sp. CCY1209]
MTTEQIKDFEKEGIGDRCIDGFGRIAVNWLEEYQYFSARYPEIFQPNQNQLEDEYHD